MKIALLLIYYNNYNEIKRLIESIPEKSIQYLIAIDGIFEYSHFKNNDLTILSNDGSTELLLSHKDKFVPVIHEMPLTTEFNKRNKYLELSEKLDIDIGIIVDTDEYFYYWYNPEEHWTNFRNNFPKLVKQAPKDCNNTFSIKCMLQEDYALMEYPRVWWRPGDMRYFNNSHYHYLNIKNGEFAKFEKLGEMHVQQAGGTINDLMLRHNHLLRTKEQMRLRRQYQAYLINYENLVQKKTVHQTADLIARNYPYPIDVQEMDTVGTCPCESCTPDPKVVKEWGLDSPKLRKKRE